MKHHRILSVRGFTLLELLVVVAIIAVGTAGVALSMRDSGQTQLEREAQRLSGLFESARAKSRASGVAVRWHQTETGFVFEGLAQNDMPDRWLAEGTSATGNPYLVLGPEPLIGPQTIVIVNSQYPGRYLRVVTDGLRPFKVDAGDGQQ